MSCCRSILPVVCVAVLAGFSLVAYREATAKDDKEKQDKNSKEDAAQEAPEIKPGPEHEVLKHFVGTWEATISMQQAPGAPAVETKGLETNTLGCGGLWLIIDHKGEFMGKPFHGHGVQGYDTNKKKYVGVWVDPMTSSLEVSEGTYDKATKTLTSKTRTRDPASGQPMEYSTKNVFKDENNHYLAMFFPGPEGKELEAMRITYKRKK